MRNPLNKRIPRDLKHNALKYLGMVIILICVISVGTSFQVTLNAAVEYLDGIKDGNNQEDGFIEVNNPISDDILKHLSEEGFFIEENFYATEHDFMDSSKVFLFDERTKIDIPTVFEGRLPESADEIALDHVYARNKGLEIGETIRLSGKDYLISGTVSLPDYSSLFMNNTDLVMNTSHFCVSVVSEEGFKEINEGSVTYRYSYRYLDRNLTTSEKNEKAEEAYKYLIMNGVGVSDLLTREQNQSISFLEMDIGTDGPFMTVFVYILVAMIAFIFAILTGNSIERESVIIGTLRSLGYSKGEIIWHYLQPTLIVAVIGSVVGNAIGYTAMIEPFISIYYNTYSVGPLNIKFDAATFVLTTGLPIVIMVFLNTYMLAKKLSLSPLKFLRRDLKKGRSRKNIKLPNFSFLNRFRLRVIIQNRGSYLMLFVGVFLASFLLMFGIGLKPLMEHYTEDIDKSLPFEYQYLLKAPAGTDEGEKVLIYEMDTWFELGKKDIGISIYGLDEDSTYFEGAVGDTDSVVTAASANPGVSVSSAYAKKMNLSKGSVVELTDKNTDKTYSFEVAYVYPYEAAMSIFMSKEALADILDVEADSYNCILSDKKLDIDEAYVSKIISRTDLLGAANQMLDSFEMVILFVNIFSVVVYMIILYIMTKVVIEKNATPISYMKVFGYEPGEIRKLYLTATTIVVFTSLVVCIPLEVLLFKGTLVFLSSMIDGYISFYLPMRVYVEIIVIGVVAYLGINGLHIMSVNKIPMTDALKNRE